LDNIEISSLALAGLLVLVVGCSEQGTPVGPSRLKARVAGQVFDFTTGVGVPGATVLFDKTTAMTDGDGWYTLALAAMGPYEPMVNGVSVGASRVTGSWYRGDFFIHPDQCVSRYGTVADAATLRPVEGAIVAFLGPAVNGSMVSGPGGWYRIDLGCPANGLVGFNTTGLTVTHPSYDYLFQSVGRGVSGVRRLDLDLQRR
jgi:hypothetical protein